MITHFTQPLTPKFTLPPCAPGLIERPQLLGLIEQAQMKQVTVIRAGPGFGKTTLAIAWARRLQQRNTLTAWLTLDDDDDEPARFFLYASHAFRSATNWVGDAAIDLLSDISLVSFDTIVSSWVNDLARCDGDVYLFLDNCHLVTDHEISRSFAYFLDYAPRQFHLVLTAVDEPSLPLSRLRAHNQLFEIDAAAMRFDEEETTRFLEREKINGLDPSEVRILHAKTEGWPAVLRIVASTLSQPEQDAGGYVRGLSGALRPVGAYLAELLAKLPERTVQFMLRTAILDRFSVDLCQAVTGLGSSRQILDTLDTGRLLLTPLDGERDWYSYHSLLAGHLRQRLEAEHGDEIPKLHRRAYRWFASQRLWTDAVRHAIAAGDADQATSWVENCAMDLVKKAICLPCSAGVAFFRRN
jgi:LuxR family maltose regulon positive regulatory protein